MTLKDPFGNGLLITTLDATVAGYAAEEFDTDWNLPPNANYLKVDISAILADCPVEA